MLAQEYPGKRVKVLRTDQLFYHRECGTKCIGEADGDIVAIDIETPSCAAPLRVDQTFWNGLRGIKDRAGEFGLAAHAKTDCNAAFARAASASNTGHSGTSVSHSINVGLGPPVRIVCS